MVQPNVIPKEDWILGEETSLIRAVLCLEHLIRSQSIAEPVRVLEVGPLSSVYDNSHVAPISVLSKKNPQFQCLGVGHLVPEEEVILTAMGNVPYIPVLFDGFSDTYDSQILDVLGSRPNIIYGQHVFENSSASSRSLPLGPYKPFEKSAEILADDGFIVIDNSFGTVHDLGIGLWEHSKKMIPVFSYLYDKTSRGDDIGIFVFQKRN